MSRDAVLLVLFASKFNELNAEISPDGNRIAFDSSASGQFEIYVRPFPDVDEGAHQAHPRPKLVRRVEASSDHSPEITIAPEKKIV